jgi:hypothetical protein
LLPVFITYQKSVLHYRLCTRQLHGSSVVKKQYQSCCNHEYGNSLTSNHSHAAFCLASDA